MELDDWLSRIANVHPVGWDLGLDRVGQVAREMGVIHPASKVVLVAGTNGKGSICQYLTDMAIAGGMRTGPSTSPHLFRFNERIAVDGEPVKDSIIVEAFERIDVARGHTSLTYFEFASLASMAIFKDCELDLAILEIGLGGRLDAMNVVAPDLCIIASIDLDHESWLGDTREAIGFEKAGILRHGIPLVLGDPDPPRSVIAQVDKLRVPMLAINRDFFIEDQLEYALPAASFATARKASEVLNLNLSDELYIEIASTSKLAGRKTWWRSGCRVLLDVAHNPAAANLLLEYVKGLDLAGNMHGLFGIYADKNIRGVAEVFKGQFMTWHLTNLDESRAAQASEIVRHMPDADRGAVSTYAKIDFALDAVFEIAKPEDLVVVFGSFSVVARSLEYLKKQNIKT